MKKTLPLWDCGGRTLRFVSDGNYVHDFPCGLKLHADLVSQMDDHTKGVINSVHQQHHERGHSPDKYGDYLLVSERTEDIPNRGCWTKIWCNHCPEPIVANVFISDREMVRQ